MRNPRYLQLAPRFLAAFIFVLTCGCGKWPVIVENRKDVESLSSDVTSIRARGLADKDVSSLIRLQYLETLDFGGGHKIMNARITDQGVKILASLNLPRLETLTLDHTDITDAALPALAQMTTVHWLSLMACPAISDKGLFYLISMTNLVSLDVRECTNITDKGVAYLKAMPSLKEVLRDGNRGGLGADRQIRQMK